MTALLRVGTNLAAGLSGCRWFSSAVCGEYARKLLIGRAFPLVRGVPPVDCKPIAKASKVRILHLPPRAERAPDVMKERGLLPLPAAPPSVMIGSIEVPH